MNNTHEINDTIKLFIVEQIQKERDKNKKLFAIKLIETIVFTLVGLLCVGVITALINLVIKG